jgi:hypothetical protein
VSLAMVYTYKDSILGPHNSSASKLFHAMCGAQWLYLKYAFNPNRFMHDANDAV